MFNFDPLIQHIIDTNNTPLEDRDMIGCVTKYKELSPNWLSTIGQLALYKADIRNPSKFRFGINNKPVVGFNTQEKGLYSYHSSTSLFQAMLWKALHNNVMIETSNIASPYTTGTSKMHPVVLVISMLQNEENGVALATRWIPYKDDPEKYFPTHHIELV